jgi:hypothetical protein
MSLYALFHSARSERCHEFNLAFQAVSVYREVVHADDRFYLLVEEERATFAYKQLKLYVE